MENKWMEASSLNERFWVGESGLILTVNGEVLWQGDASLKLRVGETKGVPSYEACRDQLLDRVEDRLLKALDDIELARAAAKKKLALNPCNPNYKLGDNYD